MFLMVDFSEHALAFAQKFRGPTQRNSFLEELHLVSDLRGQSYHPYLTVFQSSGWGKSRLMFEFCRQQRVTLLYFCLRKARRAANRSCLFSM